METYLRAVHSIYVTTISWLGKHSGGNTDDCSDRAFLFSPVFPLCPGKHFLIAFMLQNLWLRTLLKMWLHPTEQPAPAPPSKNTEIATVKQRDSQEILSIDPLMQFSVLDSEHLDLEAPLW